MLVSLLLGCRGIALTTDQQDELRQLMVDAQQAAEPFEAKRKEAFLASKGTLAARPDLGSCPVRLPRPVEGDLGSFADGGVTFALSTAPISVVQAKDLGTSEGPRYDRITTFLVNDVQSMIFEEYRARNQAEVDAGFERARQLGDPTWLPYDGTLVIDRYNEPVITGGTFEGGLLVGRFYVYSYADQAIVCAAQVRAGNSDTLGVHIHQDDGGNLVGSVSDAQRDLYRNGVLMGLDGLSRAGLPVVFAVP